MQNPPQITKKACESFNNTTTLGKIAKQKDLLSNSQNDQLDSQPTTSSVAEDPKSVSSTKQSRKSSHSTYSNKEDENFDVNICSSLWCFSLDKLTEEPTRPVLAESSLSVDQDPLTLFRDKVSKSAVELLASLKSKMMCQASVSIEDSKHLKRKIHALEEENDRLRKDVQFFQDIIDQTPASSKKSESRFVASLLRLMYTENYLGTHTMAANLSEKKNMDDNELFSIINGLLTPLTSGQSGKVH
ncbi:hypothetical protein OUZ56_032854 [Daphnia magna]|uniref:GRIP domain-containing protein n=1 Tax=Daphnia magna TaxID=35525 RepID=A0ABR0B9Q8_9CRUS|nr:hypothetical protein OUZ56_032854 [Daphnia magna]